MKKILIIFSIIVLFISIKAQSCPLGDGWGWTSVSIWVLNSDNQLCEVIIEYCVKLEYDDQGTPILTTVYDRHYYPDILCGLKVPQNYYFWNIINEAILNDLYSKQTIWPLCTAGKYTIVKTVFDHCIKYINDPVNGILKTELCMDKPMTCKKTYHVCLIQREPPIFRTDLILIESNSNCPVFLPYYPWGDGTVNPPPPDEPWGTDCYTPPICGS